ncbi:NurA domain protein [Methanolacinia petrolearia DSM 11571]|uniref:NurA domain protein n=1 Tax=Methanolacinia petrolearia (strain DSM 11571 / OCM 486 / SEBR 4847) TaxID=679926 RepID=E1RKE6_METP4|nr:DNA double-strand break repair nuclease NurA [Methanolacinia petrolearia]ADN35799.1 NurA domain protein [Methanolacinia petrolearia DSM 11571]
MRNNRLYRDDLDSVAGYINGICSGEPLKRIIEDAPINPEDFRSPANGFDSTVAAVDGSNAMILESGSFSVVALRAVSVAFRGGERLFTKTTPLRLPRISKLHTHEEYLNLYKECFKKEPKNLIYDEPSRAASVFRDTLEYWTAKETVKELRRGDCLMLDGSLKTSHATHHPVISDIVEDCKETGIYLVSVSKRTSLTWNGFPLDITLNAVASEFRIKAPWYIEVPEEIIDQKQKDEWQNGRSYIIKLHPASEIVLRAEIPKNLTDEYTDKALSACAEYSGDGRIPGYPYPLMEAHRECCITQEITDIIRQDVIGRIDENGIDRTRYNQLFGDLHDEFARY